MDAHEQASSSKPEQRVRMLKIEEEGDFFEGRLKPKIRLMGRWLERAGFKPGSRVCVSLMAPGVIELRLANESKQTTVEQSERPF